jgi:hypothetical protein
VFAAFLRLLSGHLRVCVNQIDQLNCALKDFVAEMNIATKITHLGPAGVKPTVRLLLGHATGFCKACRPCFVN